MRTLGLSDGNLSGIQGENICNLTFAFENCTSTWLRSVSLIV